MKNLMIVSIVLIVVLAATSFAEIEVTPPSSGGGGGSSFPNIDIEPKPVNPSFNSSTQMPGFNSYLNGSNNQEWWHQWEGNEGHWHEAESTGYYNFNIDQGFMGNQYLPVQSEISIIRWDDNGNFNIRADFKMISPEFLPADYLNTPSGGNNWNAFGIDYNTNISMGHQTGWDWETGEEFITADVTGWFSYNFQDSLLVDATDRVSEWQMWGEKGETPDGLRLTAWFNLEYTGDNIEAFNNMSLSAHSLISAPLDCLRKPAN